MDLGMREWMLIAGGILVLVVLVDGIRRVLDDKRSNLRMRATTQDPIDNYLSELPNGGARVIPRANVNAAKKTSGNQSTATSSVVNTSLSEPQSEQHTAAVSLQDNDIVVESMSASRDVDSAVISGAVEGTAALDCAQAVAAQQVKKPSIESLVEPELSELLLDPQGEIRQHIYPDDGADAQSEQVKSNATQNAAAVTSSVHAQSSDDIQYRENPFKIPNQQRLDLDESAPLLMDSLAEDEDELTDLSSSHGFVPRKTPKRERSAVNRQRAAMSESVVQHPTPSPIDVQVAGEDCAATAQDTDAHNTAQDSTVLQPVNNDGLTTDKRADPVDDAAKITASNNRGLGVKTGRNLLGRLTSSLGSLDDLTAFGKANSNKAEVADEPFEEAALMSQPEQAPSIAPDQHIEIINVHCKDADGIAADQLHRLFTICDIQLNKSKIYVRHEKANGQGAVQFNIANLTDSGVFAPDESGDIYIPGLCFFITIPGPQDPIEAFEAMYQAAEFIAKNVNGCLKDRQGSDLNKQVLDYYRTDIIEHYRRHRTELV